MQHQYANRTVHSLHVVYYYSYVFIGIANTLTG